MFVRSFVRILLYIYIAMSTSEEKRVVLRNDDPKTKDRKKKNKDRMEEESEKARREEMEDWKEWMEYKKDLMRTAEENMWAMKTLKTGDATHYPKPGDSVRVHYESRLIDGTLFDSSKRRSQPLHFMVGRNRVIRGTYGDHLGENEKR